MWLLHTYRCGRGNGISISLYPYRGDSIEVMKIVLDIANNMYYIIILYDYTN